jgi:hypothetical protein
MNKLTEGVGKKIVEALKQQSEIEIQNVVENPIEDNSFVAEDFSQEEIPETVVETPIQTFTPMTFNTEKESFANDLEGFEIPTNVMVLKQLINQLPAGVSKQTGAQIIKQTMEALGISMSGVLQEARQMQETLANNSKECQSSIVEYKKQITVLEARAQQYQKQYVMMNDIINLFIQTTKM